MAKQRDCFGDNLINVEQLSFRFFELGEIMSRAPIRRSYRKTEEISEIELSTNYGIDSCRVKLTKEKNLNRWKLIEGGSNSLYILNNKKKGNWDFELEGVYKGKLVLYLGYSLHWIELLNIPKDFLEMFIQADGEFSHIDSNHKQKIQGDWKINEKIGY